MKIYLVNKVIKILSIYRIYKKKKKRLREGEIKKGLQHEKLNYFTKVKIQIIKPTKLLNQANNFHFCE